MGLSDGRRVWLWNALLTALLLALVLVLGNQLAREHLALSLDLSEEQLSEPSAVETRIVGELDDLLRVRAYFTGQPRLGVVQIAKRTLVDQLETLARIGRGRVELEYLDPNESSAAREEARALGIVPVPVKAVQGTSEVSQETWLGLSLRYRGREQVLPFVLPQTFEPTVLAALRRLTRETVPTLGLLAGHGDGAEQEFLEIRKDLQADYRVRELFDLALGQPIPDDVSVLIVAGPRALHPRAVFAIDQFLQRGGRALFLIDRVRVDLVRQELEHVTTGLEQALALWGVDASEALVWDQQRSNRITTHETIQVGGESIPGAEAKIPYPFWPNVGPEGMDPSNPVSARLEGADLFWAQALEGQAPAGLERGELLRSSASSWLVAPELALVLDPRALGAKATELLAREQAAPRALAVTLRGRFPSPFSAGAPAPLDPLEEALARERQAQGAPPRDPPAPTSEPVRDRAAATEVVVVGDADWVRNEKFMTPRNRELFLGLVDWLALDDDLLALRTRAPRARAIEDFLERERRALGLLGPAAEGAGAAAGSSALARLEEEAQESAARARWWIMAEATLGALAGAFVLGGLARALLGRAGRARAPEVRA